MENLKHGAVIAAFFEGHYESWMSDNDKRELVETLLRQAGKTLGDLDAEIETGVRNGYPVEFQLALARGACRDGGK